MNSDDVLHDLDKWRTRDELFEYMNKQKEIVHSNRDKWNQSLLKTGRYKNLLEEFWPLCCFSRTRFLSDYTKFRIVLGNQDYDAIAKKDDGTIKKIEFSSYIDGETEHEDAKSLIKTGLGILHDNAIFTLKKKSLLYLDKIIENAKKKSIKDYSGVDLVIVVDTSLYFEVHNNDPSKFINILLEELREISFKADSVFLMKLSGPIEDIDKNTYKIR